MKSLLWLVYIMDNTDITIQISVSSAGKNLKIKALYITIGGKHGMEPSTAVNLNIANVWIQHETVASYIKDNYIAFDINLDVEAKDRQIMFRYYGTATTLGGETEESKKEVYLHFVLHTDVTHR